MEPLLELELKYEELMVIADGIGLVIERNKGLSANFKEAGLPDLATPQSAIAGDVLEKLRELKSWYEQAMGVKSL